MRCEQSPERPHTTEGWGVWVFLVFLFFIVSILQWPFQQKKQCSALCTAVLHSFFYIYMHSYTFVCAIFVLGLPTFNLKMTKTMSFFSNAESKRNSHLQELRWNHVTIWLPHKLGISVAVHTCVHAYRQGGGILEGVEAISSHHFLGHRFNWEHLGLLFMNPSQNQGPTKTTWRFYIVLLNCVC